MSSNKKNKVNFIVITGPTATGKTKIALDNACILYNRGKIDRLLVVAPKGAYMNWVDLEIPTHVPNYIEKKVLAWKPSTSAKYKAQLKNIMDMSDYRLKIMVMNVDGNDIQPVAYDRDFFDYHYFKQN